MKISRQRFGKLWRTRIEEDLVEVLSKMGHSPQKKVKLVLKSFDSETTKTFERVAMTEENRNAIYEVV